MSNYSVYIPRIFNNIPTEKIVKTFELLNLGKVEKVDIIMKTNQNGNITKMAFVHFSEWYTTSAATYFRENIENPNVDAKLVYDDPWYWIVYPNTSSTRDSNSTYTSNDIITIDNRLKFLENEIAYLYHNLLPNEMNSANSFNSQPMSISELNTDTPLHQEPNYAKVVPENYNNNFDETLDLSSDDEDYDNSMYSIESELNQLTTENRKLWVTVNYCGNA
jgi:hypothetical protein